MTRGGSVNATPLSAGEDDGAVVQWRRIALDKQLPTPRFPAGVWVPATACCCALLLIAALCATLFGAAAGQQVPQAVVDSQQQLVAGLARVLANGYEATVDTMDSAADRYADGQRDPAKLLDGLDDDGVRWAGTAVLEAKTRRALAARGEPVPVALLGSTVDKKVTRSLLNGDQLRVLIGVPLADGRLLAGVSVLRVRQLRLAKQQAILVGLASGPLQTQARFLQGADPSADKRVMELVRRAVRATDDGDPASRTRSAGQNAVVAVAAPVGDSDFALASTVRTPLVDAGPRWLGVPPAVGLLLGAGLAFGLLWLALVRPLRRLLGLAKARACGETGQPRGGFWLSEAHRIAAALDGDRAHKRTHGRQGGKRRRGVPAVLVVLVAALDIVFWAVSTLGTYGDGAQAVPAQVVSDTGNQIESVSIALGDVLDSGRAELATVALRTGNDANGLRSALDRMADRDSRYRSLYLADKAGRPQLTVGRKPLRRPRPLPGDSGVLLDNDSGRLPVIYAHTRTLDGRSLVAEFDVPFLARLLKRIDGHVRVVDAKLRTILDTSGYRAFQPIPPGASRVTLDRQAGQAGQAAAGTRTRAAAQGQPATPQIRSEVLTTAGGQDPMLVASTPLSAPASTAQLKWTVVAERPASDLRLPANDVRRAVLLAAGAAIVLAVLMFGWHYLVLSRPLRRLAAAADRLAGGQTEDVISPQRHDEIGAIAACLEICRQVRVDGERRLAGAARLRGNDHDFTTVMPAIRVPVTDDSVLTRSR
jgi:HAMP domain-containing protein